MLALTWKRAFALFLLVFVSEVVSGVPLPPFVMKLIVVGVPETILEDFDAALDKATASHLESSLSHELDSSVSVDLQSTYFKSQIPLNLTGGVDLSVVDVAYLGATEVAQDVELELLPLVALAFGNDGRFETFSALISDDERLARVGKLQIGVNNITVGEGDMVATPRGDIDDDPDDELPNDAEGPAVSPWTIILIASAIVSILIVIVAFRAWRAYRDKMLEKKKAARRQANKRRRLAQADGRSFSTDTSELNSASESSEFSPKKLKKKKAARSHVIVSKPSREARREKRLLSIAEQDEDESSCEEEPPSKELALQDSFVSCDSNLSFDGVQVPSIHTGNSARASEDQENQPSDIYGVSMPGRLPQQRAFFPSTHTLRQQRDVNNQIHSPIPSKFNRKSALRTPRTFGSCNHSDSPSAGSKSGKARCEMNSLKIDSMASINMPVWNDSVSSFGAIEQPPQHGSQVSTEKPVWSDLMSSVNSNNSTIYPGRPFASMQQQSAGKPAWSDLMSHSSLQSQSESGKLSLESTSEQFLDDGIVQTSGAKEERSRTNQENRETEVVYDGTITDDLGMSCAYFDLGEETIGNKSMRWDDMSFDLDGCSEDQETDIEYGLAQNRSRGSTSKGPGWSFT